MGKSNLSERMYAHFHAWQSSGLSQRSYSSQNGLRIAQFNYWTLKFRKEQSQTVPEESSFVPLIVTSPEATPVFEIHHSSGHRISFFELVDPSFLKLLL